MYTLNVEQARDYITNDLGVQEPPTTQAIYRWCREGVNGRFLPHLKVGKRVFINPDELREFLVVDGKNALASQDAL